MSAPPIRTRDKWRRRLKIGGSGSPNHSQTSDSGSTSSPPPAQSRTFMPYSTTRASSSRATLTPDLWSDALQTLSESDQRVIRTMQDTISDVQPLSKTMDELVKVTKAKQDECRKKSYKFRFRGKDIILGDVAEKIVIWLHKFKDIGDIAVNFDPVHASLPWAGVRFLLQAAVVGYDQMGSVLISIERIAYLTNRCRIYEGLYTSDNTPKEILNSFHEALVALYTVILQLMALVYRLLDKTTIMRNMHALVSPDQVSALVEKCRDMETRVDIEAQNCHRKLTQEADIKTYELLESLSKPILRTDANVCSLLEATGYTERLRILNWISELLYTKHHKTVSDQRTEDTGEWLLRHDQYKEWQDESSSVILWLHGTAGTGKTYLASRVIDDIQYALANNPNHEGLAFFYCNRNEAERQEPLSVLRSFVRQLSTTSNDDHSISTRLKERCIQAQLKASELTMNDCKELVLEFLNLYPKTTLILDALDECKKEKRRDLIEIFDYFLAHASRPVKIFISSRPDGDIRERFKNLANIEIQATDNHGDISRFVETEIMKHRRWKNMSPELQGEIIETLQVRSQGMFQWAYLQIVQLLELSQVKDIRKRLGKLPNGLKATYDEIRKSMIESEKRIADRAFQWVMCSIAPLSTEELLQAVSQDEGDDEVKLVEDLDEDLLLEYCHNLLVIDRERNVWVPSHLSVIEYFENHFWDHKQANYLVATVCILTLMDPTAGIMEEDSEQASENASESASKAESVPNDSFDRRDLHRLKLYAEHHWMNHVRICQDDSDPRLSALVKKFLGSPTSSSTAYRNWYNSVERVGWRKPQSSFFESSRIDLDYLEPDSSAAPAICAFGLYACLSDWWESPWTGLEYKSKIGRSLLQLAAMADSLPICKRLIVLGVDLNEQLEGGGFEYGSALAAAAEGGNKEIVKLLIESGAEVNMQLQTGKYGSALAAARHGEGIKR
ncbi:hypothetical protein BDZ45DRAFT_133333 [Acephala macrosclerotiorum]|nr:hypothetical protein BDZ45DRAFT_133333 [Acephala macrosclerotiorum]